MERQIRLLKFYFFLAFSFITYSCIAQTDAVPVFKYATAANREKTHQNIINNSITKNLSQPLSDSTEEDWEDAFYALELIHYKQPWVFDTIKSAFINIEKRSTGFQRTLLELCYVNYPTEFNEEVADFLSKTNNAKNFAMAAAYLAASHKIKFNETAAVGVITALARMPLDDNFDKFSDTLPQSIAILKAFENHYNNIGEEPYKLSDFKMIFSSTFLPSNIVVYSIQRKNRNYPGLVIVRDAAGNFIRNDDGSLFAVPQLARSITNLPYYLTNGNTPQGIFRMFGFAISKSPALGPTQNIQLTMPFETSIKHFLKDSTITDSVWTIDWYKKLLPAKLQDFAPLFETYTASMAGRTEIIAHGTTVDPEYYKNETYYPHTPTEGCLCTKEIWSPVDGKRSESDQQKLVNAISKAGGPDGYVVVIEIDDQQKAVTIDDILPLIKK
ncbi:MAG: hypothetical protein JST86_21235 [Bacteroidetes bacterium]|nr:hypothetical protein [Bacteroidota bacterium]